MRALRSKDAPLATGGAVSRRAAPGKQRTELRIQPQPIATHTKWRPQSQPEACLWICVGDAINHAAPRPGPRPKAVYIQKLVNQSINTCILITVRMAHMALDPAEQSSEGQTQPSPAQHRIIHRIRFLPNLTRAFSTHLLNALHVPDMES